MEIKFLYHVDCEPVIIPNPHVRKNTFKGMKHEDRPLPKYQDIKEALHRPVWDGHAETLACYDKAWELAFGNLRTARPEAGFVSDFIDTAFNGCLFMWDSSFIVMFGKYASHIFDFQKTLDNFYSHQHGDGFICREICEQVDGEVWGRDNPCSTGPNVLPWAEWVYYEQTGDKERLARVFDPLLAYHNWLRLHRSWPDGTYWSCGWACGMDDQPRLPEGYDVTADHGFMSWIDICAQQYMSAVILQRMARILGREDETGWLKEEEELLEKAVDGMWDPRRTFYFDKMRDGTLGSCKSIGAYWTLLAGLVPAERRDAFVAHLDNEKEFKTRYRIPSLSADDPMFTENRCGWRGAVWAPTNYMVLKGLRKCGYEKTAHEIGRSFVDLVTETFVKTGTLHENYRPNEALPNDQARPDFVGWTGLGPIAVLFEYVFGIEPDAQHRHIDWHVNLTERHGVENYRLGDTTLSLICEARCPGEEPKIRASADRPVTLRVIWENGEKEITIG